MKSDAKELAKKLCYNKKNLFSDMKDAKKKQIFDFAEGYKKFLDGGKTERECVGLAVDEAKKRGYKEYTSTRISRLRFSKSENATLTGRA